MKFNLSKNKKMKKRKDINDILNKMTDLLKSIIQDKEVLVSTQYNILIIESFLDMLSYELIDELSCDKNLISCVQSNFNKSFLNSQPVIFILYYLALNYPKILQTKIKLTKNEIRPIFNQLGISTNDFS